ncbi:MAG: urea carboxylase-associated family protein [Chloroflexi bacterium]|nr:urea carboxylase-associated family protein [Chloroflexota bacterium]
MKTIVNATETHLVLLDRLVGEGTLGDTREKVLRSILVDHARHLLSGGSPTDTGGWHTLQVRKPEYGPKRYDETLQPVTGKALPVYRGEVLRIVQVEGGQCVDFNGYNLHDYKEYLDCGYNRLKGLFAGKGVIVWSGSPRARPMYLILEAAETCDQYYAGHRCNAIMVEKEVGLHDHPNCQDTFAEAIREFGLTPDDVHDSYNFWMATALDSKGKRYIPWNRGRKGDCVDLLCLFDTLSVPVICGGDLYVTNSLQPTPIQLCVFEASPSTLELVDMIQERLGRYRSQKTPKDFKIKEIKPERELKPDPHYRPDYIPAPRNVALTVDLPPEEESLITGLADTGLYGPKDKVLAAVLCRWYMLNRALDVYTRLSIT